MKKLILLLIALVFCNTSFAADIIDEWDWVVPAQQPILDNISIDAKDTALIVMDIEQATCNIEKRPRCIETLPAIKGLINRARKANMFVVYTITMKGEKSTILPEVKPLIDDPVVQSTVNKFFNTSLDALLKNKNIKNLILTGTQAHGAILFTATEAVQRGYRVIIPVDTVSASSLYAEQATLFILTEGPGTKDSVKIIRTGLTEIK
jgi:nicotinamidase-related amidase